MKDKSDRDGMEPAGGALTEWMRSAFAEVWPAAGKEALAAVTVVESTSAEFGEYQCSAAMPLSKVLKKPPREIAQAVATRVLLHESVERMEVAGPGFLNLHIKTDWLERRVEAMAADARLCVPAIGGGDVVVMDYGSPNMSKPLHIGHLRSADIGSALDRIFRFLGYKVIADNHLGDWGTQFGITLMGYRHFGDRKAMLESPMEELERVYVASYARGEADEAWMDQCRNELVKLQAGDPDNVKLWREFMELSLKELDRIYGRLGVRFDLVRGESWYNDRLQGVLDLLVGKGLARESEGALVVFLEEEKLPVALVRKKDGASLYLTTDIATVISRVEEFKPAQILYVTDERQQLHFNQLFAISRRLGIDVKLGHVWFGLMRLPEGTFSTRQGNVIKLEKLLDEAEERALAVVQAQSPDMPPERQKQVARAVGLGAVKYADLSQNPQSIVTFTWDKAMALDGNSAPYLQYAVARISSVRDKYKERFPECEPDSFPIRIAEPVERALAVKLARFPEALVRAAESRKPNILCDYLYDLAQAYSSYYQNVPFLKADKGIRESRVRLCGTVASVLRKGLDLLGIETPERI